MKILLINMMYIGDLLFTTPLIRALHQVYPDAEIDMLIDRRYEEVLLHNPRLHRLIAIEKKGHRSPLGFYAHVIRDLRREQYDVVLNLHRNERSSAIAAFSDGRQRCGFAKSAFRPFFTRTIHERTDIHQADAYLEVLRTIGVPREDVGGLEMYPGDDADRSAAQRWHEASLEGQAPVIGINTGGSWPTKRWTVEGFAALADLLRQEAMIPVFFGGPTDVPMVNDIVSRLQTPPVIFTGKISLLELAAMARRCAVFVSGDSGPMHIASTQQTPVVAIFGPSSTMRYAPYHVRHQLITAQEPCLGCGQHACAHHRCMTTLPAETVAAAIRNLLA